MSRPTSMFRAELRMSALQKQLTPHQHHTWTSHLRERQADCVRFYPWPALVQSLQQDIDWLEKLRETRAVQNVEEGASAEKALAP